MSELKPELRPDENERYKKLKEKKDNEPKKGDSDAKPTPGKTANPVTPEPKPHKTSGNE